MIANDYYFLPKFKGKLVKMDDMEDEEEEVTFRVIRWDVLGAFLAKSFFTVTRIVLQLINFNLAH